jgi:hypothetical protein
VAQLRGITWVSNFVEPFAETICSLTLRRDPPVRVEVLEHQHILVRLVAHIVELLLRVVLQIHGRAHVLSANVVRFDEISVRDCAARADGEGVVLYDAAEGSPDAECKG